MRCARCPPLAAAVPSCPAPLRQVLKTTETTRAVAPPGRAHNPKVASSNLAPATRKLKTSAPRGRGGAFLMTNEGRMRNGAGGLFGVNLNLWGR